MRALGWFLFAVPNLGCLVLLVLTLCGRNPIPASVACLLLAAIISAGFVAGFSVGVRR